MNDIKYPLYRDDIFSKAKRMEDYSKYKGLYQSICSKINTTNEKIESSGLPRNPRQDISQQCDKNNIRILQRQKLHLEEKMKILEEAIKKDIEDSKNEL
jgi:hypothetical protein